MTDTSQAPFFTIVICTFNRLESLNACLQQLNIIEEPFHCIVVDNFLTPQAHDLVNKFNLLNGTVEYIHEPKKGINWARLQATKKSKTEWIIFLDDDVIIAKDFLLRARQFINQNNVSAFGGKVNINFTKNKPSWMDAELPSELKLDPRTKVIKTGFISSAVFCIRKEVLLNYFSDVKNNMQSPLTKYAENINLQAQLKNNNVAIAYHSAWQVTQNLPEYKYDRSWHEHAAFNRGQAEQLNQPLSKNYILILFLWNFIKSITWNPVKFIFLLFFYSKDHAKQFSHAATLKQSFVHGMWSIDKPD